MIFNAMKYKHIIWDFNGTILDDAWLCVEVLCGLLKKRNMPPITLDEYQQLFDFPVIDYYRKIGFNFDKESFDIIADEYIAAYEAEMHNCKLRDGIIEMMDKIKSSHQSQSVLSAAHQDSLEKALTDLSLMPYFTHVAGLGDYYAHSKIDVGHKLMAQLELNSDQVLLIGDTTHDFQVATQIGADCVLIPGGHQTKQRLIACGAKICDSMADINFD